MVDGKPAAQGGGPLPAARKKYAELREVIEPLLEKDAEAKIELTASKKDNEISIKANVSNLARTGDNIRLRFILVEDHVRHAGGNGVRYHHGVARAFPGGAKGVAMTKKSGEFPATIKLDEVRSKINEYLDELAKQVPDFTRPPLALKNLRVVALIQDDDTGDVLQAAQVEIR